MGFISGRFHGWGRCALAAGSMCLLLAVGIFFGCTGPRNLEQYPPPDSSPYRLPWTAGESYWCVQGNRGIISHSGRQEFAYDFKMPVGTDVRAARGGVVVRVVASNDGHGYQWPNNLVAVRHEDGTVGYYLHIKKEGNRVVEGEEVRQGQVIASSGHVGNSMLPHLHFHVTNPETHQTIPITFADVTRDSGIPRALKRYTSANTDGQNQGKNPGK